MTETPRESVLSEASGLITGDRNKTYGSPTENFDNTAAIWNALLGHKLKEPITSTEVGTLMVGLKLARTIAQPKRDNFVDMAGYAACAWECEEAAADAGVLVYTATSSAKPAAPRYFRVGQWGLFYRLLPGESQLTFVPKETRGRLMSAGYKSTWDEHEISVDEVPEWAR